MNVRPPRTYVKASVEMVIVQHGGMTVFLSFSREGTSNVIALCVQDTLPCLKIAIFFGKGRVRYHNL